MNATLDLREIWEVYAQRLLQIETKYGEVFQGKLLIVDFYSGRQGNFRKITDLKEYQASQGLRGVQEMILHTIDIKSVRPIG